MDVNDPEVPEIFGSGPPESEAPVRAAPVPASSGSGAPVDGDDARAAPRQGMDPAVKAAGIWLHTFARTLKTCRLYDAANPAAVRFREELARSLGLLLADHGPVTFRFTADDVTCDGQSLYPARSREDNLAFAFFRDGVRGLTLEPGTSERECNAIVDAVLSVTGQN